MRLPRPSRAQLGTGALVIAALSVGRVVTEWLPEGPSPIRAHERHARVGEVAHLRYADAKVTEVDGGKQLATTTEAKLSPGVWVTVVVEATPTVDNLTFGYAELRTGDGAVLTQGNRNVRRCRASNPGVPTSCIVAFEVDPTALPGSSLVLGRFADDQRGDDMLVVDLGVARADADRWATRTEPVELDYPRQYGS